MKCTRTCALLPPHGARHSRESGNLNQLQEQHCISAVAQATFVLSIQKVICVRVEELDKKVLA